LSLRGTKQSHYYLFGRDPKKGQAIHYNLFLQLTSLKNLLG
jgi:hypothetical protein